MIDARYPIRCAKDRWKLPLVPLGDQLSAIELRVAGGREAMVAYGAGRVEALRQELIESSKRPRLIDGLEVIALNCVCIALPYIRIVIQDGDAFRHARHEVQANPPQSQAA